MVRKHKRERVRFSHHDLTIVTRLQGAPGVTQNSNKLHQHSTTGYPGAGSSLHAEGSGCECLTSKILNAGKRPKSSCWYRMPSNDRPVCLEKLIRRDHTNIEEAEPDRSWRNGYASRTKALLLLCAWIFDDERPCQRTHDRNGGVDASDPSKPPFWWILNKRWQLTVGQRECNTCRAYVFRSREP
ncbi:hypothetical protein VNO77_27195 [Canavalia gladiata]|uniref:Uncharacterized protein n=1 Tax=Canavalia gladiata TaxID=3824 RepID=A0AAN9Q3Z4_CANGL